ncbi:alpha/beta hydrolase [Saccharomonospora sp. NPDC046836]|uniref:alpha/beta fold hydrolase n=1 Tax=Saccharomonospora sp. NPDC046836 TaxID=3156921 RepID=UPI0033E8FC5A
MALTAEHLISVPGLLSRWVRLPNGVKSHYVTSGEDGPAVILIHGGIAGSSGTAGFRHMAPFLGARGFRVYCPDLPGFGLTTGPIEEYEPGFSGIVDYLHDFASALCLDRFFIGGNSMGCSASLMYMVAHPERVKGAALIAGNIGDHLHWQEMAAVDPRTPEEKPPAVPFDGSEDSMRRLMSTIILDADQITDDLVAMRTHAANLHKDAYARVMGGVGAEYRGTLDANVKARLRMRGRLEDLTIPTVYVYGREDVVLAVEAGYAQEDLLPNFQFFYPEKTGHQAQTDSPELINQLFLEFFRDGRVSRATAAAAGVSGRRPPLPNLVEA